jgi:hypothetical protein
MAGITARPRELERWPMAVRLHVRGEHRHIGI